MPRDVVKLDGDRINALRLRAGMTRAALSLAAGISPNSVFKAIAGEPVTLAVAHGMARGLKVSFSDLLIPEAIETGRMSQAAEAEYGLHNR